MGAYIIGPVLDVVAFIGRDNACASDTDRTRFVLVSPRRGGGVHGNGVRRDDRSPRRLPGYLRSWWPSEGRDLGGRSLVVPVDVADANAVDAAAAHRCSNVRVTTVCEVPIQQPGDAPASMRNRPIGPIEPDRTDDLYDRLAATRRARRVRPAREKNECAVAACPLRGRRGPTGARD